ncbi:hypothetical protein H4696_002987 [Amycolatopsis lexingtonensis]|uniref:Uncharacterized protein n=1 Tax=Amycolatopsis lexingtonensis TaxID=218822 RepID=A0ABR9HY85_9PSEU|nr:DUF6153 family protein [Amycolatopsis lexingtonensis]MBE1495887.1 hypothetical protein [Amycolatopsis lexingtonensis]
MTADRLGKVRQVILLCALAVCVAAMHHVGMSSGMPEAPGITAHAVSAPGPATGAGDHDPGMPGGMHDILHLCLAVLYAFLLVVAFLGVSRWTTAFSRVAKLRGPPGRGRPPDRRGRGILTSLCVLRV